MPNRLAAASSPYLRQHAGNPVDWHEWGPEALARAQREDKPIHLSVGYAACHWCHVMAHESFEDPGTAALLNELFVNIKVDREERPDLDGLYMQAVQAMTGRGGWPMTVFLLPDGTPFYGGTYFPPDDRHGLPGFPRVLRGVAQAYRERREDVRRSAERLREIYDRGAGGRPAGSVTAAGLEEAEQALASDFDGRHGGFGGAPKFPPSMVLSFLLTRWARTGHGRPLAMALETFRAMARGGIFDQLGGGLHRYSVDERWLVPHFEKMLYDNALFVQLGAELWQATRDAEVRDAVAATLGWLAREMRAPEGGFYSSIDADSEGHEGRFYVWSAAEIRTVAGADADVAIARWGVTESGNFEDANVLHVAADWAAAGAPFEVDAAQARARVERARAALLAMRERRPRPARDDKIVASWNGLMLRALAVAARALDDAAAARMAIETGEFLLAELLREGRIRRAWREGVARSEGFLEDQGAVGLGLLELYGLTGERRWLDPAVRLAEAILADFWDAGRGMLYDTPHDHERLISRPADPTDNATPSGTSLAAELCLRVGQLTGRADLERAAQSVLEGLAAPARRYPQAFGHALAAMDRLVHGGVDVVLAADGGDPGAERSLLDAVGEEYVPALTLIHGGEAREDLIPAAGKLPVGGRPTAFVCRRFACGPPATDPDSLRALLREFRRGADPPASGPEGGPA